MFGECGIEENGIQYVQFFVLVIRDVCKNGQFQNYFFKFFYCGYMGFINFGDGDKGMVVCLYNFYVKWISDLEGMCEMVEVMICGIVGMEECLIEGIFNFMIVYC